jgi:hypothetical protein
MSNHEPQITAALRRLSSEARSLSTYQTTFVTQPDIQRVTIDTDRLLAVLAITDPSHLEEPEDLVELRERLNIVRADIASLLVSVQNLHEKAEAINATLANIENIIEASDEML